MKTWEWNLNCFQHKVKTEFTSCRQPFIFVVFVCFSVFGPFGIFFFQKPDWLLLWVAANHLACDHISIQQQQVNIKTPTISWIFSLLCNCLLRNLHASGCYRPSTAAWWWHSPMTVASLSWTLPHVTRAVQKRLKEQDKEPIVLI